MSLSGVANRVFVDHYAILNVPCRASESEIKQAFRSLAKIHHPDHARDDGMRFLEIYSAYRLLLNPEKRRNYDRLYLARFHDSTDSDRRTGDADRRQIPLSRVRYPGSVARLARRGLMQRRFRNRDRRFYLNIDYDLELHLEPSELHSALAAQVPVVARNICPDCLGSDPDCYACDGKGWYKSSRHIEIHFDGGLIDGQILEINLSRLKPGPMSHFKKKRIRLKICATLTPKTST
ncbi:MAG: DnaJ domain-containing protein [Leptospiraceae bacterium]|nr:DnaJ domain-containing protein [Leptospiraceae bacterium]